MDIDSFRGTDTDLGRFLAFCDCLNEEHNILHNSFVVEKEDWDYMCGISVMQNIGNGYGIHCNFYNDGLWRAKQ